MHHMWGTVFLGSQFTGILPLRREIYNLIEEKRTLKCMSFQKGQIRLLYRRSMLEDIANEISTASHFIFLIGPDEGTTLNSLHESNDVLLGEFETHRDLTFTHFEAKLAKARL